jgi:hypothetical protein
MNTTSIRVLTALNIQRLGLQNRVMRKLRERGCQVLKAAFDTRLTIEVGPGAGSILRRGASCLVIKRGADADLFSIEIDGCLITWTERKT